MKMGEFFQRYFKPDIELTIGECRERNLEIVCNCGACGAQTKLNESELPTKDNFEVRYLDRVMRCPACGHSNGKAGNISRIEVRPLT
jgi:transcription elongation factor Elf1